MRNRSGNSWRFASVAVAVGCGLALTAGPAAADPGSGGGSGGAPRQGGDCSATVLEPQAVTVFPANQQPYEFLVQATVSIDDPGRAAGCALRVCVEEEHGPGNWHAEGCGISTVDPAVADYYSLTPYVDCDSTADTGNFRSYVRFEDSTVARVGVARAVCR